jgi:hypothetical protein
LDVSTFGNPPYSECRTAWHDGKSKPDAWRIAPDPLASGSASIFEEEAAETIKHRARGTRRETCQETKDDSAISGAASLAAVTCRVEVPTMGDFPFDHLHPDAQVRLRIGKPFDRSVLVRTRANWGGFEKDGLDTQTRERKAIPEL